MKTLFLMLIPFMCFAQIHRPLPAMTVCAADGFQAEEPDIHARIPEEVYKSDSALLERISILQGEKTLFDMECSRLRVELNDVKEQRRLEKKIAGIAGLLLFATGNNDLKNVGLISLFCYSIW